MGNSETANIRFFDAITHCIPGATTMDVHNKLCVLLPTLPTSVIRIVVHVGSNDTVHRESEITKRHFLALLGLLQQSGKSVFISGPIPTVGCEERFSRLLSQNFWLQNTCREHGVGFIDNFNVFWHKDSLFKRDGLHPNSIGSRLLANNILCAVQLLTPCCSRRND